MPSVPPQPRRPPTRPGFFGAVSPVDPPLPVPVEEVGDFCGVDWRGVLRGLLPEVLVAEGVPEPVAPGVAEPVAPRPDLAAGEEAAAEGCAAGFEGAVCVGCCCCGERGSGRPGGSCSGPGRAPAR